MRGKQAKNRPAGKSVANIPDRNRALTFRLYAGITQEGGSVANVVERPNLYDIPNMKRKDLAAITEAQKTAVFDLH